MLFRARTPAPAPAVMEIMAGGARVCVAVRVNARARRFTLKVKNATRDVVLTIPPRANRKAAREFVERHGDWIAEKLQALPSKVTLMEGALIPLRGVPHRLCHGGARGTVRVEAGDEPAIVVFGPPEHFGRRVLDFLKREAKRDLAEAVARYAGQLGVTVGRISLKDTKSRWGSCSAQGHLAFSFRLVMAPPMVLDYLAAHEVTHRREMNHSARFWSLLESVAPHTAEAEAWLKAHGGGLHHFG